jgi:hypothetical protein
MKQQNKKYRFFANTFNVSRHQSFKAMRIFLTILSFSFVACSSNVDKGQKASDVQADSVQKLIPIWDSTNKLSGKTETLHLQKTDFSCWCAKWLQVEDIPVYEKWSDTSSSKDPHIFIEPANQKLYDPEGDTTLLNTLWTIQVIGQFYEEEDYPRGTFQTEEYAPKAKVFRYTDIKLIKGKQN